jgi:hypothetical protein
LAAARIRLPPLLCARLTFARLDARKQKWRIQSLSLSGDNALLLGKRLVSLGREQFFELPAKVTIVSASKY